MLNDQSLRWQGADMELRVLVGSVLLLAGNCVAILPTLTQVHTKFEYKYSFKGPYLINSKGDVPFWSHGGSECPVTGIMSSPTYL